MYDGVKLIVISYFRSILSPRFDKDNVIDRYPKCFGEFIELIIPHFNAVLVKDDSYVFCFFTSRSVYGTTLVEDFLNRVCTVARVCFSTH